MDEMKKMVDELEAFVNVPKGYLDFMPHERLIAAAVTTVALRLELTDRDLVNALTRIIAFLNKQGEKGTK